MTDTRTDAGATEEYGFGTLIERAAARLRSQPVAAEGESAAPVRTPVPEARSRDTGPRSLALDFEGLERRALLTPQTLRSRLAEEMRVIKRTIRKKVAAGGEKANLVMVTSALPGDGKTFTAFNLAVSLAAERDAEVVLVDADFDNSNLFAMLQVDLAERQVGLSDLLLNPGAKLADYLLSTDIERLSILAAGRPHDTSTELLTSPRMADLVCELTKPHSNRIVIFDTAPILMASQPMALLDHVGQAIFVVRAGKTPRHAVEEALERFDGFEDIGIVLNRAEGRRSGYGSYYGYGYGKSGD